MAASKQKRSRLGASGRGGGCCPSLKGERMRIYLAARYIRREELARYAAELRALGHVVTSRWVDGQHEAETATQVDRARWAAEDWDDLMAAECCVSFTERPRAQLEKPGRGGRHVEFGAAMAAGKRLIVVGWRENVFHCLPDVEFVETWEQAKEMLANDGRTD
jgi:hypothetical protein